MSIVSIEHDSFEIEDLKVNKSKIIVEDEISYKEGAFELVRASLPTIFAILFQLLLEVINIAFVGNLNDPDAMATVGLSWLTINAFLIAPGYGILGGIDTLVSTAFGNKQYYLCGVYLNRARIIQIAMISPFMIFLIFSKPFFHLLGQDPKVSEMAQYYIWVSLPGVLGAIQFQATKRFMMAMKVFQAITYFQVFLLIQHLLTSILFIFILDFGYIGAALATTTTNLVAVTGLTIVLKTTNLVRPESFHFFNKDSFTGLREYMVFGIPSMIMLVIEWVSFEVMGIYAGIISVYSLGAHTILANVMGLFYMITLGLSFTTMAHIGNSLGKGEYKKAKIYFNISYVLSIWVGMLSVSTILTFSRHIFPLYTQDSELLNVIYETIPGILPLTFFGSIHGNMKGIFKTIGKQIEAAAFTSVLYIFWGNGFSLLFGFYFNMNLSGIWIGFGLAWTICAIIFTIRIFSMDWRDLTRNTLDRLSNDKKKILI